MRGALDLVVASDGEGVVGVERGGRYWLSIEEMKAEVEPLPFVPAMCMALRESKSDG